MTSAPSPERKNPFPAEAVVTYGTGQLIQASLQSMLAVEEELAAYLVAHPTETSRYGGAIGIRGGHGSGKTHSLMSLAEKLRGTKSITGAVLYGKCDSTSIPDLYRQIMQQVSRPHINSLIQLALLKLARTKLQSAEVTEALAERLEDEGALLALQAEENLDLDQLQQELLAKLEKGSAGTEETVRILLDIPHSRLGPEAYKWLTGEAADLAMLGANQALLPAPGSSDVNAAANAITALEVIAGLHRLAGVPLLVLIDQLEVLLRTDSSAIFNQLGSLIKKLIEQLSKQAALTFIAGTPEAWGKLPPDVNDRLRRQPPITVGSLTRAETDILIGAYMSDQPGLGSFPPAAVDKIHELSGGSPREILRILHQAFEAANGDPTSLDSASLLRSARSSGSIEKRAKTALAITDSVLARWGTIRQDVPIADELLDRAVVDRDDRTVGAVLLLQATDSLDEIAAARRVHKVREECRSRWPECELLIVTIGYSSAEIRSMLADDAPIPFNEQDLASQIEARLGAAQARRQASPPAPAAPAANDQTVERIDALTKRLDLLAEERQAEMERISNRISEQTQLLIKPQLEARQVGTRSDLSDALYAMQYALDRGDIDAEREYIRSILVGNETFLDSNELATLGSYYREILSLEQFGGPGEELALERLRLIGRMRRALYPGPFEKLMTPRNLLLGLAISLGAFLITGVVASVTYPGLARTVIMLPPPRTFVTALPYLFGIIAALFAYATLLLGFRNRLRHGNVRQRIEMLQKAQEESRKIRQAFPQA